MDDDIEGYETKEIFRWEPEDLDDPEELAPKVKYKTIVQEEEFLD
jgi:hypothetical protein